MAERAGMIITIDGPAGAGKSTVARGVAKALAYTYLNTGSMYRALALLCVREDVAMDDAPAVIALLKGLHLWFDSEGSMMMGDENIEDALRSPVVSMGASIVSRYPEVRTWMVQRQQEMSRAGAVVLEGRDTGTVVCPQAELKIFLDADVRQRAERRFKEQPEAGRSLEQWIADISARDTQDQQRSTSPLVAADDAIHIDSSQLSAVEVVAQIVSQSRLVASV